MRELFLLRYIRVFTCLLLICNIFFGNPVCQKSTKTNGVESENSTIIVGVLVDDLVSLPPTIEKEDTLQCSPVSFRRFYNAFFTKEPLAHDIVNVMYCYLIMFNAVHIFILSFKLALDEADDDLEEEEISKRESLCILGIELLIFLSQVFFVVYFRLQWGDEFSNALGDRIVFLFGIASLYAINQLSFLIDVCLTGCTKKTAVAQSDNNSTRNPESILSDAEIHQLTYDCITSSPTVSYSSV